MRADVWACPCGRETALTLVSLAEPRCPFCGRPYSAEHRQARPADLFAAGTTPDKQHGKGKVMNSNDESEMIQFNPDQQARALLLLERMAWGDMDYAIRGVEDCLRLALEATVQDFNGWELELGPAFEEDGYDEFSLPREVIEEMGLEEKLAYVARLLRSLAGSYGVSHEFGRGGIADEVHRSSPAALLRGLNELL